MEELFIREKEFWIGKIIPGFIQFKDLNTFLENRRRLTIVFPHVFSEVFRDVHESAGEYDDEQFHDLYRRLNLIKGIFHGVNYRDEELDLSTADLLRKSRFASSSDPRDYFVVAATIWDVDFPRPGDKKRPFSDKEIGMENRHRLFNLIRSIRKTDDTWRVVEPGVFKKLPFRISNSLVTPMLFALNTQEYPITNQAVRDAILWLKGKSVQDERSYVSSDFPIPVGMEDYLTYAAAIKRLSNEFEKLLPATFDTEVIGLGFIDAFFWWLGSKYAEKRVWVIAPGDSRKSDFDDRWDDCLEKGYIAIGWDNLGDLSSLNKKTEFRNMYDRAYPDDDKGKRSQNCGTLWRFAKEIKNGDLVIARRGRNEAIGLGHVSDRYRYDDSRETYKHLVDVDWDNDFTPRQVNNQFGMQTVLEASRLTYEEIAGQSRELERAGEEIQPDVKDMMKLISKHRNLVLYGPPGTGKTYLAREAAVRWLAKSNNIDKEKMQNRYCYFVQFHPSFSYEEFVRGLTVETQSDKGLVYTYRNGIFIDTCLNARKEPNKKFVLIIDEINRGDIPRIFGELMFLLEYRGEEHQIQIQYPDNSGNRNLFVPENLHIIGTMNTADRSIALLDTALRRRFFFHEVMPDTKKLTSMIGVDSSESIDLRTLLETLNRRIRQRGLREKQIGHSYFMSSEENPLETLTDLMERFNGQILPLLQEYFYDDLEAMVAVVGNKFINTNTGEIIRYTDEDVFLEALKALRTITEPEES